MFKNADWIWHKNTAAPDEYIDFKLCFNADIKKSYILHLSCDTNYAIYKGDSLVAFGQYGDYPDYKVYDSVNLDKFTENGENEFIISVWYVGIDSQTYIKKPAGLIFKLEEDGKEILCSSADIKSRISGGFIPHSCERITVQLGLTYSYDTNKLPEFFFKSRVIDASKKLYPRPIKKLTLENGFDVNVIQKGSYCLTNGKNAAEQMLFASLSNRTSREITEKLPVALNTEIGFDGVYLIADMGRETAGLLEFSVTVDSDCDILIGWGEHLADGRCRTAIGDRNFSCRYKAKSGENYFLNPFLRIGCRYLQIFIASSSAEINKLTIRETLYPLTVKEYRGNNLLRRTIYDVCVNTLRQCMHEHYEDCPWREQALYTLDSRNQMLCGYYAFGETRFARACLNLISYGRRPDGILSLCYPAGHDVPIPAFSLIYPIQMREYMDYSSDLEFIEEKYSFLKNLTDFFTSRSRADGLIPCFCGNGEWNFYEWAEGLDGYETISSTTYEAPLNAFLSLALENMAQIAERLGKKADAENYLKAKILINKALSDTFFDKKIGLFRSFNDRRTDEYSMLTNSLCLLCGAAENLDKTEILKVLTFENDKKAVKIIPNTISMNCFRFDALLKENREKYAPIILDEIDRTYLTMLREGATAFWETAKGYEDFEGAASLCHGWSALPVYYYSVLE